MKKLIVVEEKQPTVRFLLDMIIEAQAKFGAIEPIEGVRRAMEIVYEGRVDDYEDAARWLLRAMPKDAHYGYYVRLDSAYSIRRWDLIRRLAQGMDNIERDLSPTTVMATVTQDLLRFIYRKKED